jgi:hypothetical protein
MLPEWIERQLEAMGIAGAIIFVLFSALVAAIAYIRQMQTRADKIYGYRLQERDTLNKALTESSEVLKDMLRVTEVRNEITEEQATVIQAQAMAFELLKTTVLAQYDNIRDHNAAAGQAVTAMAEAIRTLTAMIQENRTIALEHVNNVRRNVDDMGERMERVLREGFRINNQAQIAAIKNALGQITTVQRKRKAP